MFTPYHVSCVIFFFYKLVELVVGVSVINGAYPVKGGASIYSHVPTTLSVGPLLAVPSTFRGAAPYRYRYQLRQVGLLEVPPIINM